MATITIDFVHQVVGARLTLLRTHVGQPPLHGEVIYIVTGGRLFSKVFRIRFDDDSQCTMAAHQLFDLLDDANMTAIVRSIHDEDTSS